jgi:hypothetical protein
MNDPSTETTGFMAFMSWHYTYLFHYVLDTECFLSHLSSRFTIDSQMRVGNFGL